MLIPERRRRVLDHVRRQGSASIEELARVLDVSTSTVRRDLDRLRDDGLLDRAYGGAVVPGGSTDHRAGTTDSDPERASAHAAAKARIGAHAAGLVADGSTVMVLAGSTTGAMVSALYGRRLTVVTNGLDIASALKHAPDITLVVLGGYLHREQMTLLGPMTLSAMSGLHVDTMLAGAWGVHPDTGVTGNKIIQAGDHNAMLRHTDRLVVLADGSKIGRRGPTLLADVDQVDTLITDDTAPGDVLDRLTAHTDVHVA